MLHDLPNLPDDVKALLESERNAPEPTPPNLRSELAQRLGVVAPIAALPPSSAPASQAWMAKGIALALSGAIVGSGATVLLRPKATPEIRYVEVTHIVEREAPPPVVEVDAAPPPSASAPHPSIAHPRAVDSSPSADTSLGQERALIETARAAVARHDGAAALTALQEHAQRFPNGRLTEEREALGVQALVLDGRSDEAHVRADHFRARYPNGLFLPVVNAAVAP